MQHTVRATPDFLSIWILKFKLWHLFKRCAVCEADYFLNVGGGDACMHTTLHGCLLPEPMTMASLSSSCEAIFTLQHADGGQLPSPNRWARAGGTLDSQSHAVTHRMRFTRSLSTGQLAATSKTLECLSQLIDAAGAPLQSVRGWHRGHSDVSCAAAAPDAMRCASMGSVCALRRDSSQGAPQ